jgi:hypothetical protein
MKNFRDILALVFGIGLLVMLGVGLGGIINLSEGYGASMGTWFTIILFFYFRKKSND